MTDARHLARGIAAIAMVLAGAATAGAQGPRTIRDNVNGWFMMNGDVQLTDRWFVDYDLTFRRSGPYDEWQQIIPRPSLRFQALPALRLSAGYAFAETWPYGKLPVTYRFPEHRLWEQVQLAHTVGRTAVTHRYRIEQRWIGRVAEEPDGKEAVQNWIRTNRARYRVLGMVPLRGATIDDGELYANLSAELFVNWGANVRDNVFDQSRLQGLLGYRVSRALRFEAGYLEQLLMKADGRTLERNHTLMMVVNHSHSFMGR